MCFSLYKKNYEIINQHTTINVGFTEITVNISYFFMVLTVGH